MQHILRQVQHWLPWVRTPGARRRRRHRRDGFTIIELLVSIGLVIMILAILAEAFTVGLDTFSRLKAIGDMSERLRAAVHQIRGDLKADHFDGSMRLSDPSMGTIRPREGFFSIVQHGPSLVEGYSDGVIPSLRAPASDSNQSHILHMAVKLRGNRRENFFGASVPGGSPLLTSSTTFFNQPPEARHQNNAVPMYMSQWAEVAYFLQPVYDDRGQRDLANFTVPLYSLHRVIRVLIADNRQVNTQVPNGSIAQYNGFSCRTHASGNVYFNTPLDVVNASNRSFQFQLDPSNPANPPITNVDTLLMSDVISFNVQVVPAVPLPPPLGQPPPPFGYPVSYSDFVDVGALFGAFPAVYDSNTAPIGLLAIQVSIRVWDRRTQQTRQITLIQDM